MAKSVLVFLLLLALAMPLFGAPAPRHATPKSTAPSDDDDMPVPVAPPLPPAPPPLVLPATPDEGPELTLAQALDEALRQNPQVVAGAARVLEARHAQRSVLAQMLPQTSIDVEAGHMLAPVIVNIPKSAFGDNPPNPRQDVSFSSTSSSSLFVNATIRQGITQLGRIGLGAKIKGADADIATEELRAQRLALESQVRDAYYGTVQSTASLQAARRALSYAREVERLFSEVVGQRAALRSYLLDARAQRLSQEHTALVLIDAQATYKEQLNALMGRDPTTPFRAVDPGVLPMDSEALETLEARALKQNPEVRKALLKVQQAEWNARTRRSLMGPDLGLQVQYLRPYGTDLLPQSIFNASAVLSWEPLDWGRKRNDYSEALRQIDEAKAGLKGTEAQLRLDVRQQYRKLKEARDAIRVAEAQRAAAEEKLRVAKERFEVKDIMMSDMLKAESEFAEAQRQGTQALFAWASARSALARATGGE